MGKKAKIEKGQPGITPIAATATIGVWLELSMLDYILN
jgi:hypothetical protein